MSRKSRLLRDNKDLRLYPLALVEAERHDWASMRCGCGQDAAHVREFLTSVLSATSDDPSSLVEHLHTGDGLTEPAAPVAAVLVNAISDGAVGGVLDDIAFTLLFLADLIHTHDRRLEKAENRAFARVIDESVFTIRSMGNGDYADEAATILGIRHS